MVDESALSLDRYDTSQAWLAKTSRHLGHNSIFIGQRLKDVALDIRSQCDEIFIFRCSRTDAKIIDDEYDEPLLLLCTRLKKFYFAWISPEGIKWGKVDPNTLQTSVVKSSEAVDNAANIMEEQADKKLDTPV